MITRLTGFAGEIKWQTDKPDGQPRRSLDVSRAYEKFGLKAHTVFEFGLKQTVDWYEETTNRATTKASQKFDPRHESD